MTPSLAETAMQDHDLAIFTKRLDTLLSTASSVPREGKQLPQLMELLATDPHLTQEFQATIANIHTYLIKNPAAPIEIRKEHGSLKSLKLYLQTQHDNLKQETATERRTRIKQEIKNYIPIVEAQQQKFDDIWPREEPPQTSFDIFLAALNNFHVGSPLYRQVIAGAVIQKDQGEDSISLRKPLQALLSLWGFETQLRQYSQTAS